MFIHHHTHTHTLFDVFDLILHRVYKAHTTILYTLLYAYETPTHTHTPDVWSASPRASSRDRRSHTTYHIKSTHYDTVYTSVRVQNTNTHTSVTCGHRRSETIRSSLDDDDDDDDDRDGDGDVDDDDGDARGDARA